MTFSVKLRSIATAIALTAMAGAASAATFTYDLSDHPNGANSDGPEFHNYGLRLDQYGGRHFSFDGVSDAQLVYDDVSGVVQLSGTMVESIAGDNGPANGPIWTLFYRMTGVSSLGAGLFEDLVGNGSGSIQNGMTELLLGAKSAGGVFFELDADGHRVDSDDAIVGRGWVNYENGAGSNDFLFLADLVEEDPDGQIPPVPLPAAGWLLFGALGGLGALRRARKTS